MKTWKQFLAENDMTPTTPAAPVTPQVDPAKQGLKEKIKKVYQTVANQINTIGHETGGMILDLLDDISMNI
jgi:hypothetical protein